MPQQYIQISQSKKNQAVSKMTKLKGFAKHVQIEHATFAQLLTHRPVGGIKGSLLNSIGAEVIFIETTGAVCMYSVIQLQHLYDNARAIFGEDRARFAKEMLVLLAKKNNRRHFAGPLADHDIQQLSIHFPHFSEAIEQIEYAVALAKLTSALWFQMPPLLLVGPAGVGKTAFAQEFAQLLGVHFNRIDIGMASTGSILSGLSLGWGSGHTGEVFKTILECNTANPLIMLDEVDKISTHSAYSVEPALLTLLENESAANFRDEAIQINLNCKHFLWIATANDLDSMSEPLKSRFTIVHIRAPNRNETLQIIKNIYRKLRNSNPWGHRFINELDDAAIHALTEYSPRELTRMMLVAFGRAASRGGNKVLATDFMLPNKVSKRPFGFI